MYVELVVDVYSRSAICELGCWILKEIGEV